MPVEFELGASPRGFYVPIRAITLSDRGPAIFTVVDDLAVERPVTVNETVGELRRIEGAGVERRSHSRCPRGSLPLRRSAGDDREHRGDAVNLPRFALTHRPIVVMFTAVLMVVGLFNFATMSRREDPEIVIRDALIVTPWPGAPADRVEELITDPIEDVIVEIPEVAKVESKSMVGISIIQVGADDAVMETEQVWDDVRAKVDSVRHLLPTSAASPTVNSDFGDVYEIVFALHHVSSKGQNDYAYSPRDLEKLAEKIEEELELIDSVARVEFWGNRAERIYVEVDSSDWAKLDLTAAELRELFQARNITLPGGELETAQARYALNPSGEFSSLADMRELLVSQAKGHLPVGIEDLPLTIERRYEEPARSLVGFSSPETGHQRALVLGVSMKSGQNVVQMSEDVDRAIARLREGALPPDVALVRVNDLPRQVNQRIVDFQINLVQGVAIVLLVALLALGPRPALIMAAAVPLSMIGAFAIVRRLGVELEQFSVASLIIALGMVVDNAIVVSDNAVRLIRDGRPKLDAVVEGAQSLAVPILSSTLTTIVVFLPMLTIAGNVGEYISSLPVVVSATLILSYFVAMLVTPIMCLWLLKTDAGATVGSNDRAASWSNRYEAMIHWCLARPGKVVAGTGAAFLASLLLLPMIGSQFFPSGARDQFFIKIWRPESSTIRSTEELARQVEAILLEESRAGDDGEARLANVGELRWDWGPSPDADPGAGVRLSVLRDAVGQHHRLSVHRRPGSGRPRACRRHQRRSDHRGSLHAWSTDQGPSVLSPQRARPSRHRDEGARDGAPLQADGRNCRPLHQLGSTREPDRLEDRSPGREPGRSHQRGHRVYDQCVAVRCAVDHLPRGRASGAGRASHATREARRVGRPVRHLCARPVRKGATRFGRGSRSRVATVGHCTPRRASDGHCWRSGRARHARERGFGQSAAKARGDDGGSAAQLLPRARR